jgi:phage shock protein A
LKIENPEVLTRHLEDMKARAKLLRFEAATLTTRAEVLETEYIRLESTIEKAANG